MATTASIITLPTTFSIKITDTSSRAPIQTMRRNENTTITTRTIAITIGVTIRKRNTTDEPNLTRKRFIIQPWSKIRGIIWSKKIYFLFLFTTLLYIKFVWILIFSLNKINISEFILLNQIWPKLVLMVHNLTSWSKTQLFKRITRSKACWLWSPLKCYKKTIKCAWGPHVEAEEKQTSFC